MSKMPILPGTWRSSEIVAGTLLESGPLLPPCYPPCAGTGSTHVDCAVGRGVQMLPHPPAGRAGWLVLPAAPQQMYLFRLVSFGPRFPSGRILQCDAPPSPEVVLGVST